MRTLSLMVIFCCALQAASATALPPPAVIAQTNLEARVIVIGYVTGTGKILLEEAQPKLNPLKQLTALRVLHVIKGYGEVDEGQELRIESPVINETGPVVDRIRVGKTPLAAKVGEVVAAYLDSSAHPGFFRPVAGGASLVVLPLVMQPPGKATSAK